MSPSPTGADGPRSERLPEELERLVEEIVAGSGLDDAARAEVRADLRQHLLDGLARGRSVEELHRRLGAPETVAPILSRAGPPPSRLRPRGSGDGWLSTVLGDLRYVVRGIRRAPLLAMTAVGVLALGIGANVVVFTVLNELLLRPLPVADPDGLADVWADIEGGNSFSGFSWQDYLTYRDANPAFEQLHAFTAGRLTVGVDGPEVIAQFTSAGYLEMLGLSASLGSVRFDPDAPFGEPPLAVLTHGYWQDAHGADPEVVGRTIRLGGEAVTVIGVGPERFTGHFIGFPSDLFMPMSAAPALIGLAPDDRSDQRLEMIGRLRDGVSVSAAGEAMAVIAGEIARSHPETNRGHGVGVTRTTGLDHSLQAGVTAFVLVLTIVALLVLVVACLNVGGVLLVRAMSRERELAVRIALGAGRARLARMILSESTVLAVLGAGAGVVAALRINDALGGALRRAAPGLGLDLAIDWRVLALTSLAALAASVVTTMAPTLHVLAKSPAGVLRSRGRGSVRGARLRSLLVIGQVGVSVVLVIATGLFVRALIEGGRADYGLDADRVAFFPLALPDEASDRHADMVREVLRTIRGVPGVESASIGSTPPIGVGRAPIEVDVPGVLPPPGADRHLVDHRMVGAGYLGVVGTPLLAGRDIAEADLSSRDRVAVVSEAFARRFFTEREAVGALIDVGGQPVTVVGVGADVRFVVQDDTPDPLLYLSRSDSGSMARQVVVRAADPLALEQALDDAVRQVVSEHERGRLRTARQVLDGALLPQRMAVLIVGAMGLGTLLLASVGLNGLIQFTVARDTHELGVRRALGGGPGSLALVVLSRGVRPVVVGTALGVAVALLAMPGLGAFLGSVSPRDPLTYGVVVASFLVVAAFASGLPLRRALGIDAAEALRAE